MGWPRPVEVKNLPATRDQADLLRSAGGLARALLLVSLASFSPAAAADVDMSEVTIKAAYLSKFGGFIHWPDGAFHSDTSPITICVVGNTLVGKALAEVQARPIGNRPVVVRAIGSFSTDAGCHILYVGDTNPTRVTQTLAAAKGAGVLTVTDLSNGSTAPVINFVIKDNRVKFEIDERIASEQGLTISSQLLGLALVVRSRS